MLRQAPPPPVRSLCPCTSAPASLAPSHPHKHTLPPLLQVQLLGATLSIGRPSGYVDPGKAAAAAIVAAEALARFQVRRGRLCVRVRGPQRRMNARASCKGCCMRRAALVVLALVPAEAGMVWRLREVRGTCSAARQAVRRP
jgi:splicing factor U2AF subunit